PEIEGAPAAEILEISGEGDVVHAGGQLADDGHGCIAARERLHGDDRAEAVLHRRGSRKRGEGRPAGEPAEAPPGGSAFCAAHSAEPGSKRVCSCPPSTSSALPAL